MNVKFVGQVWNYFKKGRNEIGLVLGLYSMILSYSIKFDVNFSLAQYGFFSLIFFVVCVFLGVFLAEKIEPEQNRISPYAQDNLNSAIFLQRSLIYFYDGDISKAVEEMEKAQALREKWLK